MAPDGTDRKAVTGALSRLVEDRLESRRLFWSPEVSFDKGTPLERRVDYMSFKPYTPQYSVEPTSVELGCFTCYEVKSCREDFGSGHGLTFIGDMNYLVCPAELYAWLKQVNRVPRGINGVLCPDRSFSRLRSRTKDMDADHRLSYRKRPASEMLWQMVQAHNWGGGQSWQSGNKQMEGGKWER